MDRRPVVSSNLKSVGWQTRMMEIEFHGDRVYLYTAVPEEVFLGLLAAPSKGKYFHLHVKKGKPYKYYRLK